MSVFNQQPGQLSLAIPCAVSTSQRAVTLGAE